MWLLFGVYGLYSGLTVGVEKALVSELCPGESRATMLGVHATLVGIGMFLVVPKLTLEVCVMQNAASDPP